jgi:hypothetical protein
LETLLVGGMTVRWGSREKSIPAEWGRGSLTGWESVRDREGCSTYPCRQVLTCGGVWKRVMWEAAGGWLIGSVFVGETPLMVSPTPFTPFMTQSKSFLAGCFDILRVILSLVGEEGSECVRFGVDDVGVTCRSVAGGVNATAATSAKAGEIVSVG